MFVAVIVSTILAQVVAGPPARPCIPPYVDQHMIFYPSGSTALDLNQAWRVKVAADYIEPGVSTVTVHSRTDTVGSDNLNMTLSRRRGQVVVDELVRLGVPAETIVLRAYGETMLLRPTADETAEPVNRMVHIDYWGGSMPALKRLRDAYCPGGR